MYYSTMNINEITLIILAGGKSSRMGSPKENILLGDFTFLETLKTLGESIGFSEIIVSGIDLFDEFKERGPLGGLYTCLKNMKNEIAFVLPVDCPNIRKETILEIVDFHFKNHKNPLSVAITLLQQGDRPEPLIGVFSKDFYETIFSFIKGGPSKVMAPIKLLPFAIYHHDQEQYQILNINTKEDLKKL